MAEAGLTDVRIESSAWDMTFQSAEHFWNAITAGNPIAVSLTGHLSEEQLAKVKQVLHGNRPDHQRIRRPTTKVIFAPEPT